jgi:hypothetical protein
VSAIVAICGLCFGFGAGFWGYCKVYSKNANKATKWFDMSGRSFAIGFLALILALMFGYISATLVRDAQYAFVSRNLGIR